MFLLPLGVPSAVDSIDLNSDTYLRNPSPDPPPRTFVPNIVPKNSDMSYYDFLVNKVELNNNDTMLSDEDQTSPPSPPYRQKLEPIFESQENDSEIV